jgi:ubiquinone/menaquinone biosynthesis C-methylase UbiE
MQNNGAAVNPLGKLKRFCTEHIVQEIRTFWGKPHLDYVNDVAGAWLDDKSGARWRYNVIREQNCLKINTRILDMASGCGAFVFYGLYNGYQVYGIEPEHWKITLSGMKIEENGYPQSWKNRFIKGQGEKLPLIDGCFDIVTSFQTLEHVSNVESCLREMLRVVRKGGCIFLHFPDYMSTYEAHYRLPWFPLLPKSLAQIYLMLLRRPVAGLGNLNYVTRRNVVNQIKMINNHAEIIDLDKIAFHRRTGKIKTLLGATKETRILTLTAIFLNLVYTYGFMSCRRVFRSEKSVALLIRKK